MPSLNFLRYGIDTEGPKVSLQQLEGACVSIIAVGFFDSEFAPGACVQIEQEGNLAWFLTFSEYIVATVERFQGNEPYSVTLMSHKSASDRTYWTLE